MTNRAYNIKIEHYITFFAGIQMSLTPILREKLRGLKAEEEEQMRIMKERQRLSHVELYVKKLYDDAINYAKTNTNTSYTYMLPQRNHGNPEFYRDNMVDILHALRHLFPDCLIRNTTLSRGQDGKMYDISKMDEKLLPFIDSRYNQESIIIDWT
jgi:hypothetical protein